MNRLANIFLFFVFILLFNSSCGLFQTRTPEEPEGNNTNFPPPTTPQIVIDNFLRSFNQKNLTVYQSCFSDDSATKFMFYPSSDVFSVYPNLFSAWDLSSEIDFAKNLFSKFSAESYPVLLFTNPNLTAFSPDSTIFVSDYILDINSRDNSINNSYKGTAQFVLKINRNGLWKITQWLDFISKNGDYPTFSVLKAKVKS